jgi:hypothetical protein
MYQTNNSIIEYTYATHINMVTSYYVRVYYIKLVLTQPSVCLNYLIT